MQKQDNAHLREILDKACELPREQREAFLESACGGDAALRGEIESLLASLDRSEGFLEEPTIGPGGLPSKFFQGAGMPAGHAGERIGRYKLLQLIGEGGVGSVFMAEQQTPVVRKVALKIIKLGMDTKQVIARFEAERQALAMMDHPNIARVLDAGTTETGRPYFVMDLVHGVPITEFCDENKLTTRQRLELFVPVCSALTHAHQKGIIHRDLKPGNVLVTMHDDKPVPKIIDFGVAKAMNQRLTEHTLFTEFRQLVGTPAYMSPEQAQMSGLDVDTRSDIYSLGVLLYELLIGTTPFDPKELRSAAYEEMQRIIREVEPPKASTRLTTLAGATQSAVADHRRCDPATLGRMLTGDLDWIMMKCLEKDRSRRYETANGLARDIQRYLNDEPVEASPPSATYRVRKLVRKHRFALSVSAAFVLTLLAATVFSSWQAVKATQARTLAQQALAGEAAQRRQAEAVAGLLESIFAKLDPTAEQNGGEDLKAQLVVELDKTAATLDKDYADEPLLRARLRTALGNTQRGLGEFPKAEALLQAALSEMRTHAGPEDPATLTTMECLAETYSLNGRCAEAIKLFEQVRDQQTKKLGLDHPNTLTTLFNLATAYSRAGRTNEAIKLYEQVRDQETKTLGADHPNTLDTLSNLAGAYQSAGRTDEAIKLFEQVRDQQTKKLGADNPKTLATLSNLAIAYVSAGRTDEAIKLFEQVRDQETKKLGADHPNTLDTLSNLAFAYGSAGRTDEAIKLFEQVRDQQIKKVGLDHPSTLATTHNLAITYLSARRTDEAIKLFEQVRDQATRKLGADHPNTLLTMSNLATAYDSAGRTDEAIKLYEQVRDQQIKRLGADHPSTLTTLSNLAGAYQSARRTNEAIKVLERVRDHWMEELGPNHPDTKRTVALPAIISCYRELGQEDAAAQWEAKLRPLLESEVAAKSREITAIDKSDPKLPGMLWERARIYLRLGSFKGADDDIARFVLLGEADHYVYFYRGCLLAYLGERTAYQANCKAMFEQFGNSTDGPTIERTAKTCLLLPGSAGGEPKQMLALIDRPLALTHNLELMAWYALSKASALYRMGDFSGCVEWAEKARTRDSIVHPARRPTADLLAAMAHFKLGHADQATAALERAERWAEKSLPKAGEGDLGWGEVVNWLVFQTFHREAAARIAGKAPSTQRIASTRPGPE